jgi:hypothetical protein
MHAPLTDPSITAQAFGLFYGNARAPLVVVVRDPAWPGVYRVVWPGGASDIANLSRAKDAAFVLAQKGPPARDERLLHWQTTPLGQAHRRALVRLTAGGGAL